MFSQPKLISEKKSGLRIEKGIKFALKIFSQPKSTNEQKSGVRFEKKQIALQFFASTKIS